MTSLRYYLAPSNRVIIGVQRSISLCMKRVTSAGLMVRFQRVLLDVALHLRQFQGVDDLAVGAFDDVGSEPSRCPKVVAARTCSPTVDHVSMPTFT